LDKISVNASGAQGISALPRVPRACLGQVCRFADVGPYLPLKNDIIVVAEDK